MTSMFLPSGSGGSASGSSAGSSGGTKTLPILEDKAAQELRLRRVPLRMDRTMRVDRYPVFPLRPLLTRRLQGAVPVSTLPTRKMLLGEVIRRTAH